MSAVESELIKMVKSSESFKKSSMPCEEIQEEAENDGTETEESAGRYGRQTQKLKIQGI